LGAAGRRKDPVKALVVEDNPGLRDVVVDLLRRRGHDVAAFADAESAWAATHHEVYHVAVLDWGLPGMDGVELCRRLRTRPGGEAGAILMLTGRADPEDVDEVVAAGVDDYLTKPFKLDWLEVRIAFAERKVADLAARARTAEALRQSEARFRSLFQNASDVITVLDAQGMRTYVSPSVERAIGQAADDLIGTSFLDDTLRTGRDQTEARRLFAEALAAPDRIARAEIATRTAQGGTVRCEVLATNLLDDPNVRGIVLNARNISERQEAEERLREAEERYRTLVEQIPVVVYVRACGDESIRYISPRVGRVLGYAPEECLANPPMWKEILHPDDRDHVLAEDERTNRTGEPWRMEYRQRHRDGRYIWIRDEADIVRDADGRPLFWQGLFADITEQREAADALRESERRQRELLAAAERQATELRLLHEVRTALAEVMDVPEVLRVVVEAAARILGFSLVCAYLIEGDELVIQHHVGYPRWLERIPLDRAIVGRAARTGRAYLAADAWSDPDFLPPFEDVTSVIAVPLRDDGRIVGVINIESQDGVVLTEADLALMVALGEHVDVAIGRARLYTAARESERRYRSVVESVQEVIFQTDAAGDWTFLNPAWTEITGHAVAASLGRAAESFIHPDDRDRYRHGLDRMVNGEVSAGRAEVRVLTTEQEVRWLDVHARAILDDEDRVVGVSGSLADVTERSRAEEALRESQERFRHLALHDPLTALPNRTLFLDRLEHAVVTSIRHRSGVAVLFLDLDGFKLVNDTLGHDAGDRLLVGVGERLIDCLRLGDTVARLGGDEFAILLEDDVDQAAAETVARRLLEAVRQPAPLDGREITVGASIGVALGWGGEICAADLLRNADIALYEAKGAGRATFAVYEPRMAATVMTRLQQETDLRWALDRDELRLHYQPVFDLKSGEVAGVEALIRWQHPERGLLPPAEFIRMAEANGLVVPLGTWALHEACRAGRQWQERGPASAPIVGVNLSARQLQEPGLVESVAAALATSGLTPSWLELEITESIVVMDGPAALRTLADLRALGVRLAIDDFGTGYASLTYLRDVPVDAVKIDRSFIAGIGRGRSNLAIVRAIVGLAHDLGLAVTAEGIETLEQRTIAQSLGVDRGQGYYFARPLPVEAIDALLGVARPAVVNGFAGRRGARAAVGA
jgi:diguanylate cyclase (GGDEF)-like protein/PAS domain S-box-containing protein